MTLSVIGASIVLVLQSQASPVERQQPAKASIQGVIVRIGSGEAIAGSEVTLRRVGGESDEGAIGAEDVTADAAPPAWTPAIPTVSADREGKFIFKDARTPGEYRIFAWESIEQFAYFDADFLRLYEQKGTPVSLQESSKAVVEMRVLGTDP